MLDRLKFFYNRVSERLWVKPLILCLLSISAVFIAKLADDSPLTAFTPQISLDSIETLLTILSSSMLVIATFAVGSMVSAYASASSTATPRSFPLIISDDVSQNALSTFIGSFIFCIVSLIVVQNEFYEQTGILALFALTICVFAIVIATFVRWVDCIARLGRLGATIDKVEEAAKSALAARKESPRLGGRAVESSLENATPIFGETVGYVQLVKVDVLQRLAEKHNGIFSVAALPGSFASGGNPLAFWIPGSSASESLESKDVLQAFVIGKDRTFDQDPRFGLIVLSEIGGRALSAAVNDPGTAIDIIGSFIRIFTLWSEPPESKGAVSFDRVEVPEISEEDLFDDAFTAIARDGAGSIEVAVRLQKAFISLHSLNNAAIQAAAKRHSQLALLRAEKKMGIPQDLEIVRKLSNVLCVEQKDKKS